MKKELRSRLFWQPHGGGEGLNVKMGPGVVDDCKETIGQRCRDPEKDQY